MTFIKEQIKEVEAELARLEKQVIATARHLLVLYEADRRDARTRAVARVRAILHPPVRAGQRASGKVRQGVATTRPRKGRRPATKSPRAKRS